MAHKTIYLERTGTDRTVTARSGPDRIGPHRTGPAWTQARTGPWSGLPQAGSKKGAPGKNAEHVQDSEPAWWHHTAVDRFRNLATALHDGVRVGACGPGDRLSARRYRDLVRERAGGRQSRAGQRPGPGAGLRHHQAPSAGRAACPSNPGIKPSPARHRLRRSVADPLADRPG